MAYAFVFTKNWILMMKTKSLFVNGPFRTLLSLFLPFQMLTVKMFTKNDWIWTADPCFWKLPLCQLSRNLCSPKKSFVNVNLFRLIFLCKLKAEMYLANSATRISPIWQNYKKDWAIVRVYSRLVKNLNFLWQFFLWVFLGFILDLAKFWIYWQFLATFYCCT